MRETGGRPRRGARYRLQLAPAGFADELRLAFADGFGRWGAMGLFSDRPYSDAEQTAAAHLVPLVARVLRKSTASAKAAAEEPMPGVLLLDIDDRVRMRDARATELLAECASTGSLPGAIHILSARARADRASVRGRTLAADGSWITIDANPLDEDGAVAIVLRPALAASVIDVRLRAAGLTERERGRSGAAARR
ncbi:MAG TPA: hypothetical protein VGR11_14325 [Solirubrobacteraceae bacterium]|nr:hypothetical protein [Solirubrobacteraceae bacterium]